MANPFEKRTTEYVRDDSAFLAVVTPEPLHSFFESHAQAGTLFDRLCLVIGTPGSGKTTIATLLQYHTVHTLINSPNHSEYDSLKMALIKCGIIVDDEIAILACRIPMESEYRDFWELPYPEDLREGLLKSFLQTRSIIALINELTKSGIKIEQIQIRYREGSEIPKEILGGASAAVVYQKAKAIEEAIYKIGAALVAPKVEKISDLVSAPYDLFDWISEIRVVDDNKSSLKTLRPLVILDDVHMLHRRQLVDLRSWLSKREMRICRWLFMRLDAQTPQEVLLGGDSVGKMYSDGSTLQSKRESTEIWLQSGKNRKVNRNKFREMAKSMADKKLRLMPAFYRQGLGRFQDLLNTRPVSLSPANLRKLRARVDNYQHSASIGPKVIEELKAELAGYLLGANSAHSEDVKLSMLLILMHRYVNRVPQPELFEEVDFGELQKRVKANASVADGARIHLLHAYKRPYYYGIDAVCDGSSENAEQFLHLAGSLVSASETNILRGKNSELQSNRQHDLLRKRAGEMIRDWEFPHHESVFKLCNEIAIQCVEKSLEPNAPLGGGANSYGVPDEEFDKVCLNYPSLEQALKYGVAYSAFSIRRRCKVKNKLWTIIELTGPVLINYGLTFRRGGMLDRTIKDLAHILEDE